jgi:hypothetical protein
MGNPAHFNPHLKEIEMSQITISNVQSAAVEVLAPVVSFAVVGNTPSERRQNFLKSGDVPLETRAMMIGIKGKDGAANREQMAESGLKGTKFRAYQGNFKPLLAAYVTSTARPIDGISKREHIDGKLMTTINALIDTEGLKKSKGLKKDGTAGADLARLLGIKAIVTEVLAYVDDMQERVAAVRDAGGDVGAYINAERNLMIGSN